MFLLLLFPSVLSLQCYTGFKYLAGQNIGTDVETCPSPTDYCYNATAALTQLAQVKMAGCSSTLCFISQNKCVSQTLQGQDLIFCCCNNGDLCNSKYTNLSTFGQAKEKLNDYVGMFSNLQNFNPFG